MGGGAGSERPDICHRCAHELGRGGGGKKRSNMLQRKAVTGEVEMRGNQRTWRALSCNSASILKREAGKAAAFTQRKVADPGWRPGKGGGRGSRESGQGAAFRDRLLSPVVNFLRKPSLLETRAVSPENFPGKERRGEEGG